MTTKTILVLGLAAATAAAVASLVIANRKAERGVALEQVIQPATTATPIVSESTPPAEIPAVETQPQIQTERTNVPPVAKPQNVTPQKTAVQAAPPAKAKKSAQDPTAREALSFVGADPDAEKYWVSAINDANLSAHERQDLIEDLNRDGLSDPKHPGPEDLPLILSRLQLIEELAPDAMDEVNADAFAEAYKDLSNMLARVQVQ